MGEATKRPHCDICEHDHWRHEPHKWAREKVGSGEAPVAAAPPEKIPEVAAPALVEKIPHDPKPKKPRQRREYMKAYMAEYRDRKREELRAYQRDYMRRRRQGGEHG